MITYTVKKLKPKNTETMKILIVNSETAKSIWEDLGNIPVNDDGEIQEEFLGFQEGTDREDIWHWIEDTFNVSVVDLMGLS